MSTRISSTYDNTGKGFCSIVEQTQNLFETPGTFQHKRLTGKGNIKEMLKKDECAGSTLYNVCSVPLGVLNTMGVFSTMGDIMSTVGGRVFPWAVYTWGDLFPPTWGDKALMGGGTHEGDKDLMGG